MYLKFSMKCFWRNKAQENFWEPTAETRDWYIISWNVPRMLGNCEGQIFKKKKERKKKNHVLCGICYSWFLMLHGTGGIHKGRFQKLTPSTQPADKLLTRCPTFFLGTKLVMVEWRGTISSLGSCWFWIIISFLGILSGICLYRGWGGVLRHLPYQKATVQRGSIQNPASSLMFWYLIRIFKWLGLKYNHFVDPSQIKLELVNIYTIINVFFPNH